MNDGTVTSPVADCPCPEAFKRVAYCDDCPNRPKPQTLAPLGLSDPLEGANCHFCADTADNFHVSDELWAKVESILGQHQVCFKCFRIAAWHIGIRPDPAWEVSVG